MQNKIVDFFYQWLLKNICNMMIKLKLIICTSAVFKKLYFSLPTIIYSLIVKYAHD